MAFKTIIRGIFEIVLEGPKNAFKTQKTRLKKKYLFGKNIKSIFKGSKSLKMTKTQNKAFAPKHFLTKSSISQTLSQTGCRYEMNFYLIF